MRVSLEDYSSVILLSYSISSGALGSSSLLLSYPTFSAAFRLSIILISTPKRYLIITTGGFPSGINVASSQASGREIYLEMKKSEEILLKLKGQQDKANKLIAEKKMKRDQAQIALKLSLEDAEKAKRAGKFSGVIEACFIWSGASDSSHFLLSCPNNVSSIAHKHHTDIYSQTYTHIYIYAYAVMVGSTAAAAYKANVNTAEDKFFQAEMRQISDQINNADALLAGLKVLSGISDLSVPKDPVVVQQQQMQGQQTQEVKVIPVTARLGRLTCVFTLQVPSLCLLAVEVVEGRLNMDESASAININQQPKTNEDSANNAVLAQVLADARVLPAPQDLRYAVFAMQSAQAAPVVFANHLQVRKPLSTGNLFYHNLYYY